MKRSILVAAASLSILALSNLMFGAYAPLASPDDCVTCEVRSGCWRCVGGGQADNCPAVSCESCTVQGLCDKQIQSLPRRTLRVSLRAKTIREIAASHPRFAATLAKLNKDSFGGGSYQVSWTPVPLNPGDIEFYLTANAEDSASYQKHIKKARRINRLIENGELAPIVYRVSIDNSTSDAPVLKVEVITGSEIDPPFSSLEVSLGFTGPGLTSTLGATKWAIR